MTQALTSTAVFILTTFVVGFGGMVVFYAACRIVKTVNNRITRLDWLMRRDADRNLHGTVS